MHGKPEMTVDTMTDNPQIFSFPPIEGQRAEVLILGSMPGKASLQANQYYAHPRNAFWPIMSELTGCPASAPYEERTEALAGMGVAIWDVLKACVRPGSLDADIRPDSMVPNDFAAWFEQHPETRAVLFNGATAEKVWLRGVAPGLALAGLATIRLPSTSPANAAVPRQDKASVWLTELRRSLADQPGQHELRHSDH